MTNKIVFDCNDKRVSDMVSSEVMQRCNELFSALGSVIDDPNMSDYYDDFLSLQYSDDWESPASEFIEGHCEGMFDDLLDMIAEYDSDAHDKYGEYDIEALRQVMHVELADNGDYEEFCNEHDLEADRIEVYEHWVVSDWLGRELQDRGENVCMDFMGFTVWGRTCTGQSMTLDYVMRDIATDRDLPEISHVWNKDSDEEMPEIKQGQWIRIGTGVYMFKDRIPYGQGGSINELYGANGKVINVLPDQIEAIIDKGQIKDGYYSDLHRPNLKKIDF